jgi:hypothetical protein
VTVQQRLRRSTAVLLGMLSVACGQVAEREPSYEFAIVGDNPYPQENVPRFESLIADVNAHPGLEWVIHVGDIRGRPPCTDELISSRFNLYQQFNPPFVYTPGDNDWFDCVGGGYDEYERLGYLRSTFFADPGHTTGGRTIPVDSQSDEPGYEEFVENVMWTRGGVVYATVHLIILTREPRIPERAALRLEAALSWISRAFDQARESGSAGVFIATQADPWPVSGPPNGVRQRCPNCLDARPGLEPLYDLLVQQSDTFRGQVVLAVGDTHIFRVDKPLYRDDGSLVENFTRVETFGNPYVHWVRVTVDPREEELFSFQQQLVSDNVARPGS